MAKAVGHPFPDTSVADPPPGFWERTLPDGLFAALDGLPRRFDAVVVDESQDFLDSWWDPLSLSLDDLALARTPPAVQSGRWLSTPSSRSR